MSQVGVSRPATQQSLVGKLPEIQHPLSRLSAPDGLGVRGVSRSGPHERNGDVFGDPPGTSASGRPLANEVSYRALRKSAPVSPVSSRQAPEIPPYRYESIPEGVEVTLGDPNKTRLPLFGSRAEVGNRGELISRGGAESRALSRLSKNSAQLRLEIDELEAILREKVKTGYYDIKKRFKDNDPEQRGNVSKDAFLRILVTITGRPVSQSQFTRLSERLGFKEKTVVNFTEFFAYFREPQPECDYPRWMDPVQRQWQEKSTMSASQVHMHLKEKAKQKVKDIAELIPQSNPDGSGHVLKPEFRNTLCKLGFNMDDLEFDKLWAKYDVDGTGTINGEKMMQKLGISIEHNNSAVRREIPSSCSSVKSTPKKLEIDRKRSLDIERFLRDKFREGFRGMKEMFEQKDTEKTGLVTHEDFLEAVNGAGLRLERQYLAEFLSRCSVQPTRRMVPYRDFLHRFQDRSEDGMVHTILTNPKHSYNRAETPGAKSTLSNMEAQLMTMFQRDFLSLLGTFHNIDKLGEDVIPQEAFRAAIESRFGLEVTDDQFNSLLDRVPLNDDGAVKYAEFMAQFDTKGRSKSLFGEPTVKKHKPIGALPRDPSPTPAVIPEALECNEADRLTVHDEVDAPMHPKRSAQELFKIIKDLLKKNYQKVEGMFYELDETNTRRMSQEMMYQLFRKCDIDPPITRGEIRDIWKTFITNQDKTLDFLQFTRHFGYSLKSAAFPNAKICPPKRGDRDCWIRSRKLNCAADMLKDNLRSKVDYMWEQLQQEFTCMDPYNTGYVSGEEFREVLSELCVQLSEYELKLIMSQYDIKGDGRISYLEFLKPFAMRKQVWRHGNNMQSVIAHPQAELPLADIVEPPQKGLHGVTAKLRQKLSGDWKNLRRAFKKLDVKNEGYLPVPEFRSVLKLANAALDEEEVYQLLSQFDEDLTGKICYNRFINETFKPSATEQSKMLRKSAVL